jgi:glycosyltransferase involved in cell wall biosynthesis
MTKGMPELIRVGFSTGHGMTDEVVSNPPEGVVFGYPKDTGRRPRYLRSPMKCFLRSFDTSDYDIIEAALSPVITKLPWIGSFDCFEGAMAFSFLRAPIPKPIRRRYLEGIFLEDQCKKIVFWSDAAYQTMLEYGGIRHPEIIAKSCVVYPAIRQAEVRQSGSARETFNLLFSGDFFRKGGANVVDAFEQASMRHPELRLRVCSDPDKDFNTKDQRLREKYLSKIRSNPQILLGRIPRSELIDVILPETDLYLLPTYTEAFGFAILEAMAFGIPVITTNDFAIPEMMKDGESGLMIDIEPYETQKMFRGYRVDSIPKDFHDYVSRELLERLLFLIESPRDRSRLARNGIEVVRERFSFATRNRQMLKIYQDALR